MDVVPAPHRSDDVLSIDFVVASTDPNGDAVTWTTEWWLDGVLMQTGDVLDPALTARDQTWEVSVVPSDGVLVGPAATATFTIDNALPAITALALDPYFAVTGDVLHCTYTFADADGDADASLLRWLSDGVEIGTEPTFEVLDPTMNLACEVTPHDGIESGLPASVPLVHPPVGRSVSPLPITGGTMSVGVDTTLEVTGAAPNAIVDLYVSFDGEGPPDCLSFAPSCVDLVAGQLYDTRSANGAGTVTFDVLAADFPDTEEVAWQPIAIDLASGDTTTGLVVLRHVSVPQAQADVTFRRVTSTSGLGTIDTRGNSHTGGAIWFDFNDDLWPDLYVANGGGRQNALYRNDGDGTFTKVALQLEKPDIGLESAGARYADVDDDGDYDVFVPIDNPREMDSSVPQPHEGGPNLLFLNEGGTFVEAGAGSGLIDPRGWRTSEASFADFDTDGCIDVFVGNWAMAALPANDNFSRLMQGSCDGTFVDVSAATGVDGAGRDVLTSLWWDANADGLPDLFVGHVADQHDPPDYDATSHFYYNVDGTTFEDQVGGPQPWLGLDSWAAMGADVADIDLDGDWDLYVSDVFNLGIVPRGNALYLGNPDGSLSTNQCSQHDVCGGYNSWPVGFADFNRDTWPDLWVGAAGSDNPSLVFVGKGDGTFEHHEQPALFSSDTARGGSLADYDGDGDVDVFVWANETGSELFRNDPVDDHHWLEIKLYGDGDSSWDAIGAVAYLTAGGVRQMRRVSGGDSAHSQSDAILHFGLGDVDEIDLLEVVWPTGKAQAFVDLPIDDIVRISEVEGLLEETLTPIAATYDAGSDELVVEASSSYVGRTRLSVTGFGALGYSPHGQRHSASFAGVRSRPATVTVTSARGATANMAVTSR